MSRSGIVRIVIHLALSTWFVAEGRADIPFGPLSTCEVLIIQNPARTGCVNNFTPDVVRVCPSDEAPAFDVAQFNMRILDALGNPVSGATLLVYETTGVVNIADGGSTTAVTDVEGRGSIVLTRAGGYGRVGVCADGVLICEVEARSPDVARTALPSACALPTTGTSFVNSSDVANSSCGFLAKFGLVTIGFDSSWDLDCNNAVNPADVLGTLAKGGVLQHFGHGAPLSTKSTCP